MPVAMMAMPVAWMAIETMFVGEMSLPPLRTWNVSRMTIRATSMPNRRRSISVCDRRPRIEVRAGGEAWPGTGAASATFATPTLLVFGLKTTCAPGGPQGAGSRELGAGDRHLQAASPGSPALTPLQIWSLVAYQRLAMTSPSLSAVIGVGWRMIDFTVFPPGVVKSAGELPAFGATDGSTLTEILLKSGLLHSESAAWPAALPSSLLFFQMSTYCLPRATLFRLAGSPSWPDSGGNPYCLPSRAAATPSAVLSFSARIASILVLLELAWSMMASMFAWAFSVFQASVNVPSAGPKILMSPESTLALRPASSQPCGRKV